jgi:multiple sugar transport system ATP-binding protein
VAEIVLDSVTKRFGNGHLAVDDVTLTIGDGDFLVIVGPSGCGKSTLLRAIAGLEEVTAGSVSIGGRDVTDAQPKDRDVAMVFQSYALYPHMTVRRNIGYPLRLAGLSKEEIDRRVVQTARLLELEPVLDRRPAQLSGGQRQRVAMGRAIVRAPKAFLMDEPLSNLDARLRVQMRAEIARLQRDLAVTTVYVTHDQTEAMTMGTRVAVMSDGRLQQVDAPQRLYQQPANLFVATFIGSPAMNLFEGRIELDGDRPLADLGGIRLPLDPGLVGGPRALAELAGRDLVLGLRPEAFEDAALVHDPPPERTVEAGVELVELLGAEILAHVRLDGASPAARNGGGGGRSAPAVARLSSRSNVAIQQRIRLVVDVDQLRVFDPATGASLMHAVPA